MEQTITISKENSNAALEFYNDLIYKSFKKEIQQTED